MYQRTVSLTAIGRAILRLLVIGLLVFLSFGSANSRVTSAAEAPVEDSTKMWVYLPLIAGARESCPSTPCAISPSDNAAVDTLLPTFVWDTGTDAGPSLLHICPTQKIPCGSCFPFCPGASGPGIHSAVPDKNLPAHQVWWAVELQSLDDQGRLRSKFSPTRSLNVVGDLPLLPAPVLIGPSGTVTQTTVTFQWEPVAGALNYRLCRWAPKGDDCYTTWQTEQEVTFPPYESGYYWWVEARNYYGYGAHNKLYLHVKPPAP